MALERDEGASRHAPRHIRSAYSSFMPIVALAAATSAKGGTATILWIIAVILVIWGIVTILRGRLLFGIVLIIVGLLVGPGGVSIFS